MVTTTLIAFVLGSCLGAYAVWRRNAVTGSIMPLMMVFASVPFYLVGLLLIYILGYQLRWFPTGGGFSPLVLPSWSVDFALNVLYHAILPAASIILSGRALARAPVGGGFPAPPFRLRGGFTVPP